MGKADCAKVTKYWRYSSVLLIRWHGVQSVSGVTCGPLLYINICEGLQGEQNYIQWNIRNRLITEIVIVIKLMLRMKYLAYIYNFRGFYMKFCTYEWVLSCVDFGRYWRLHIDVSLYTMVQEGYIISHFPKLKADWTVFPKKETNAMKAMHMKQRIKTNFKHVSQFRLCLLLSWKCCTILWLHFHNFKQQIHTTGI